MMKYCLVREDGLFLGRRPNGRWYYTTSPSAACRLPPVEALTALHACIPAPERALWTLRPAQGWSSDRKIFFRKGLAKLCEPRILISKAMSARGISMRDQSPVTKKRPLGRQ